LIGTLFTGYGKTGSKEGYDTFMTTYTSVLDYQKGWIALVYRQSVVLSSAHAPFTWKHPFVDAINKTSGTYHTLKLLTYTTFCVLIIMQ